MAAFLLSPEARDLRPLLLRELVDGMDLLARDQLRRAYSRCFPFCELFIVRCFQGFCLILLAWSFTLEWVSN